jgi:hypothetical protein
MDATTIAALGIGAAQLLLAFLTWVGWDKRFMMDKAALLTKRSRLVPVLIVGGLLLSSVGFYRAFTADTPELHFKHSNLVEVRGRTFRNEKVLLDGYKYTDCVFENVTFVYGGTGATELSHSTMKGFAFQPGSPAVGSTVKILGGLGMLREGIPVLGEDFKPLEGIVYPPILPSLTPTPIVPSPKP